MARARMTGSSTKHGGDGTGFDGFPPSAEGLSHLDGDEANKLSGTINSAGSSARPGGGGEEGSHTTPLAKERM